VVNESGWYVLLSWATSVGIAFHIIYGTVTFSSVLFISVRDSIGVVCWFMGSVLVCRIVLMYELASLRDQQKVMLEDEQEDEELLIRTKTRSED
jgi:hypothetical protein